MTHGIAIAEWLLAAFGVDDTLRGDIAEERAAGRSFAWLAGQTAAAIAAQVARDLRGHPVLAMRAIATGYLLTMAWSRLGPAFWPHPSETNHNSVVTYRLLTVFVWPVIVGWAVARTHRAQSVAMVLSYVTFVALWSLWHYASYFAELSRVRSGFVVGIGIMMLGNIAGGFLEKRRVRIGTVS